MKLFWNSGLALVSVIIAGSLANAASDHGVENESASIAATRATSERYHLLYYVGKQGILNRVVPELAAKHRDK